VNNFRVTLILPDFGLIYTRPGKERRREFFNTLKRDLEDPSVYTNDESIELYFSKLHSCIGCDRVFSFTESDGWSNCPYCGASLKLK
jgi:hypothetical protein